MAKKTDIFPSVDLTEEFARYYRAAPSFEEADTYLTSAQVCAFVRSILPGYELLNELLQEELRASGYLTELVDGEVMWLLVTV